MAEIGKTKLDSGWLAARSTKIDLIGIELTNTHPPSGPSSPWIEVIVPGIWLVKMGKDGEEGDGLVTALYKLNLHCPKCAREVRKPLIRMQGVRKVDYDIEKGEIKVHGKVDVKKVHQRIEKISKKKVEMVILDSKSKGKEEEKIEKKETLSTTVLKVHLHCAKCEYDLKKVLLKHKGVYGVKSDMKAQTLSVEGTLEPPKLVEYIHKKIRKHAEIVQKKVEKKEEKVKEVSTKIVETTKITEVEEEKKVEVKVKESNVPYIVHYTYAPQLFSDENPNACSIL